MRALSIEVFSRFGNYGTTLPPLIGVPEVRTMVAETDGRAIGFAMVGRHENGSAAELLAIAVRPRWQSCGVGRLLLGAAEEAARQLLKDRQPPVLRLTVAEDNAPARRLFERCGYARRAGIGGVYPNGQRSIELQKTLTC